MMKIRSKGITKGELLWIINESEVVNTEELLKRIEEICKTFDCDYYYGGPFDVKENVEYLYRPKLEKDYFCVELEEEIDKGYIIIEKNDDISLKITLKDIRVEEMLYGIGVKLYETTYYVYPEECIEFIKEILAYLVV